MTQRNREAVSIDIMGDQEMVTGVSKGRVTRTNWVPSVGAQEKKDRIERYTMDQKKIQEEIAKRDPLNIRLTAIEEVITKLMMKVEEVERSLGRDIVPLNATVEKKVNV
jgi:hypothetical protein